MIFPSPIHNPRSAIGAPRPGLALPMTIIAVAGLTLLLVGLLTVLTLERKTARSYSNAARADLAVESGLAVALGTLTEIAKRDDSIVFRIEDPVEPTVTSTERPLGFREQFFTYGAIYENGNWRGLPLFSGATETALGTTRIDTASLLTSLGPYIMDAVAIGRLSEHDQNVPRAKWVEIPAIDAKDYTTRYSYWIEDLSGRIDGRTAATLPRGEGLSPAEIDYATILEPTTEEPTLPISLTSARANLLTPASIRPLFTGAERPSRPIDGKRLEPYIYFFPDSPIDPAPPKTIPQGFGYADAGQPTPDLNKFVTDKDVDGLTDHIKKQIPTFEQRKGGFPASEDYVKTIAASIIDYADTDNDATTGTGYRGVDSYPFVNELFDRYEITGQTDEETEISVETYIELWNLSHQQINGEIQFTNINTMRFKMPPNGDQQFAQFTLPPQNVSIPPNGFKVLYLGEKKYTFANGVGRPVQLIFYASQQQNFELRWNGLVVDKARYGVERTGGFLEPAPRPNGDDQYTYNWKGNASPTHNTNAGQTGDPRASYYVDSTYRNHTYNKSNWGGRSEKRGTTTPSTYEVRISDWPDKGSSSTSGIRPPNDKVRPISKSGGSATALENGTPYPLNQPEMAPAFISNSGRYDSLAELGNVFDPAQWEKIEDSAAYNSQKNAGGGVSLAIGRPELPPFDKDGLRAAQLLDIFSLSPATGAAPKLGEPVNINTAPREVLRTLLGGLTLSADPANPAIVPPRENQCGDLFADNVIARRAKFPLRSFSDLTLIGKTQPPATNEIRFFGNPASYPAGVMPGATWDDAGREELFRKVGGLVKFQSKTFRIVVAGETLDTQGRTIARSACEYHYRVEPQRDANGMPLPASSVTFTKLYEKNL